MYKITHLLFLWQMFSKYINLKKKKKNSKGGLERKTKIITICGLYDHLHRKPKRIYKYLEIIEFNKVAQWKINIKQ